MQVVHIGRRFVSTSWLLGALGAAVVALHAPCARAQAFADAKAALIDYTRANIEPAGLIVHTPDLDDVFLALTGR